MAFTGINLKKPKADFDEGPCSLRPKNLGRISPEAKTSAFLYRYRAALSAPLPHRPSKNLKTKIPETGTTIDKELGWT